LALKPREILQLGYVCKELEVAIDYFVDRQDAGPFYVMDIPPDAATYFFHGKPLAGVRLNRVAFGYRGPLQFELIQSDNPIFDHIRGDRDLVFHHCMQMSGRFETDVKSYADAGFATMGIAQMPGVLIHYIDTLAALGHFTELFDFDRAIAETDGAMFKLFELMHAASNGWDGRDRLRQITDLMH
jgi:hypothetical protein